MRTGQVCGLTWDDIDFEKETINIQHNVYDKPKDGKGRWYIGTTKTETGTRKIHLSQTLKIALQNYKKKQDYFKKIYEIIILSIHTYLHNINYHRMTMSNFLKATAFLE